jgi:predicted site-specific integrase-resolvase
MTNTSNIRTDIQSTIRLLIPRAAANLLNVSEKTLANWRCSGFGPPFVRVGRLIRYREADLHDFILRNRRSSTSAVENG